MFLLPGTAFFNLYVAGGLKKIPHILLCLAVLALAGCSGSRKYFKAAERLEKQGLLSDAAEYYLESLQRKPTNVKARIKLKEVGQKHINTLASDFFRNYNTQQLEASLESFEKLRDFTSRSAPFDVRFDYPKSYEEDYNKAVETYCTKNYSQALLLVNQKKFAQALPHVNAVKKYNNSYKNIQQLDVIAVCEPLYQSAITNLENKNYSGALSLLASIQNKTPAYKDYKDLLELASAQQTKGFILFEPQKPAIPTTARSRINFTTALTRRHLRNCRMCASSTTRRSKARRAAQISQVTMWTSYRRSGRRPARITFTFIQ